MANKRLLDITYNALHPVTHLWGVKGNIGFAYEMKRLFKAGLFRHTALRWCPVCTLMGLWLWVSRK